jgi:hypothetical protein
VALALTPDSKWGAEGPGPLVEADKPQELDCEGFREICIMVILVVVAENSNKLSTLMLKTENTPNKLQKT